MWEKYVEQAADAITYHPGNRTGTPESRHAVSVMLARAVLATVGPLIAEDTRDRMVAAAAAAVQREGGERADPAVALLQDFIDPDPCWYDHHGYCQAHGWFDDDPACPHARARKLLAEMGIEVEA